MPIPDVARGNFQEKLQAAKALPWFVKLCPAITSVHQLEDITRLPLTTPEGDEPNTVSLGTLSDQLQATSRGGLVLSSGGSTGGRKLMLHSWAFNQTVLALGARGVLAAGEAPQKMLNCLTAGELQGAFLFVQGIAELLGARVYPLGWRSGRERILEIIQEHGIDTLVSTPSLAVAVLGSEELPAGACSSLKRLFYIGERFPAERQALVKARLPGLEIRSLGYSSTETGPIGFQCAHLEGTDHHIHQDAILVEILERGSRQPAPVGVPGDVVITPLAQTDAPLFRYRIGDVGTLMPGSCPCGSTAPVLRLHGRTETSIKLGGAIVSKGQVLHLLQQGNAELDETDVQVVVRFTQGLAQVKVLLNEQKLDSHAQSTIEHGLRSDGYARQFTQLPGVASLDLERVSPATFQKAASGKAPFFLIMEG